MAANLDDTQRIAIERGQGTPSQASPMRANVASNRITIQIGLPRSQDNPKLRVFDITIPSEMTSGELKGFLAKKFNKNEDKWEIVVTGGKESPVVLDSDKTLVEYSSDKTKRLYFYPGIFEK